MRKVTSILICLAITLTLLSGCGKKEIDISVFADVTVSGLNGHATATVIANKELKNAVAVAVYGKDVTATDSIDSIQQMVTAGTFADSVKYEIAPEKKEDLKNGDILTIKATFSKATADSLKISLSKTTFEYTVEGLADAKEINPFDGLVLTYEGVSPNGTVSIDKSGTADYVKNNVSFTATPASQLANGDIVDITATYDAAKAVQNGIYLTQTEKQYTAADINVVPSDVNSIDKSAIDAQQLSVVNQYIAKQIFGHSPQTSGVENNIDKNGSDGSSSYKCTAASASVVKGAYLAAKDMTSGYVEGLDKYVTIYEISITIEKTEMGFFGDTSIPVGTTSTFSVFAYVDYDDFATDPAQTTILVDGQYKDISTLYDTLDEAYNDAVLQYQADMTVTDIQLK